MIGFIDIAKERGGELMTDELVMLSLIPAMENSEKKAISGNFCEKIR